MKNGKKTRFRVNSVCRTAKAGISEVKNSEGSLLVATANVGMKAHASSFLSCGLALCEVMGSKECFMVRTLVSAPCGYMYIE